MRNLIPFVISGLPADDFAPLFEMSDAQLASRGARRCTVDSRPGYPCRVSLEDGHVGEQVILLPYPHHPVAGPYQGIGPIYVRVGARQARLDINEVPEVVRTRFMSVRAYDADGFMVASNVIEGREIEKQIVTFFSNEKVSYLHLHNAKPGCYSCRVDRANSGITR